MPLSAVRKAWAEGQNGEAGRIFVGGASFCLDFLCILSCIKTRKNVGFGAKPQLIFTFNFINFTTFNFTN